MGNCGSVEDLPSNEPNTDTNRPKITSFADYRELVDNPEVTAADFEDHLVKVLGVTKHLHIYSTRCSEAENHEPDHTTIQPITEPADEIVVSMGQRENIQDNLSPAQQSNITDQPPDFPVCVDQKNTKPDDADNIPIWARPDPITGHTALTYALCNPETATFDRIYTIITYCPELVNQPQLESQSVHKRSFLSFPLILALKHALPIEIIQLLMRNNAIVLCFDVHLRFPLHYLCMNYIYRIDPTFLSEFLTKCENEITIINQKHRSQETPLSSPDYVSTSLFHQADRGLLPRFSHFETPFDYALLEPQNINELINIPPANLTKDHENRKTGILGEPTGTPGVDTVEYDETVGQFTPLESALISASKCLLSTETNYTVPCNFKNRGIIRHKVNKMIEWKDILPKNQRAGLVIDCVRMLIDFTDNVTAEGVFDFETAQDDTPNIIDEDKRKEALEMKKQQDEADKAIDLHILAPTLRYPQLHLFRTNPLAVAMDLFAKNTQWGLCILPALLIQGQTRPFPRRHLTMPSTYRYLMLYYASLTLPNRPRFNGGLLTALFFHPNPFIHNLFRLGLTKPPSSSDVLFTTSIIHATSNLHRLLTLLQYLPDTMKQEAIFQRVYEQMILFRDTHGTANFDTLMKVSPKNPWLATVLSKTAMKRHFTFADVGNLQYGVNSNELIEKREFDETGNVKDIVKKYHPALPVNFVYDLLKTSDETFESYLDPGVAELFAKTKYQNDILIPYTSSQVQRVLLAHQTEIEKHHSITVEWSMYSIFPNQSRIDASTSPKRSTSNNNENEYRKQVIEYQERNDVMKRTPFEMSRTDPIVKYGGQLLELQSQHQTLCEERLIRQDILIESVVHVEDFSQFSQINPLDLFNLASEDNLDGGDISQNEMAVVKKELPLIDAYNALAAAILDQYLTIICAWRNYFVENPFIGNIYDEDLRRSRQIQNLLSTITSVEQFYLAHYPHSYDRFITDLPNIDHYSHDSPISRAEMWLSTLNPLYASFYKLSPVITSTIEPFPSANSAPIITLHLLDFISIISSGALFKQPTELLNPPTSEQFFAYLQQLLAQQKETYATRLSDDQYLEDYEELCPPTSTNKETIGKVPKPKPCLNPITIPQPGTTVAFSSTVPPGLFWWTMYYSPSFSYDDVMLLCQHCRTDILNPQHQSLLMVAIAKHWPAQNILPLLRCTININQRDIDGRTAMHYYFLTGCYMSAPELLDILIFEYGAVLNLVDSHGHSPLSYAIYTHAPEHVLIKLLNYTLLRTPKQYEVYYQFFHPNDYQSITNQYLNPAPHFSPATKYVEDDKNKDKDKDKGKTKDNASVFIPPSILRTFVNQDFLQYRNNHANLTCGQFIATMNGLSEEKRAEWLQGTHITSPPPIDFAHEACNIPPDYLKYLNCPMNVNYLTNTVYANDACLPIIIGDSELGSTTPFSPGVIPSSQFSTHSIETRTKSILSGGVHTDKRAITSGLFLSIHEVMLRCHTPWPVIQHLISLIAFGLAVTGALNPDSHQYYPPDTDHSADTTLEQFDKTSISQAVENAGDLHKLCTKAMDYLCRQLPKRAHPAEELFESVYNIVGPGSVSSVSTTTLIEDRVMYGVHMLFGVDASLTSNDDQVGLGDDSQDPPNASKDDPTNSPMNQSKLKKNAKGLTKMTRKIFLRRYTNDVAGTCKWAETAFLYGVLTWWKEWKALQQ